MEISEQLLSMEPSILISERQRTHSMIFQFILDRSPFGPGVPLKPGNPGGPGGPGNPNPGSPLSIHMTKHKEKSRDFPDAYHLLQRI